MAISKERLEELIREKGDIYWVKDRQVRMQIELSLANITPREKDCILKYEHLNNFEYLIPYEELTDNEEDAKWFLEFGNIERTEILELPTWEEFKNKKIKTVCFKGKATDCFFELYENTPNNRLILLDHDCDYEYFNEELTKENYTLACRQCVKLFKGE